MKLWTLLITGCTALGLPLNGQIPAGGNGPQGRIIGRVLDAKSATPIEFAAVSVMRETDSTIVGGALTGANGNFDASVPLGKFIVRVELLSYKTVWLSTAITPQALLTDLGDIKLDLTSTELGSVTVEAERPLMQLALDKKVFNVDKDLSAAGGSALDALENVPSVTVDMDGNVALRGSQAVRILIDGKPSTLMGVSGSQGLDNIPANQIESIEIITNPSARYEAEGMSGIINIVLKKQKKPGLNGLFSAGTGYPHNHSANINLNYGMKKVNAFGNVGTAYRSSPGGGYNHRITSTSDTTQEVFDTRTTMDWGGWNNNARVGADWTLNPRNTITTAAGVSIGNRSNPRTVDYRFYDSAGVLETHYDRINWLPEVYPDLNYDASLLYKRLFKGANHYLTMDGSYSAGTKKEVSQIDETYYLENYLESARPITSERSTSTDNQWNIVAKLDYSRPIKTNGKFEAGYRLGMSEVDRDYFLEKDTADEWVYDSSVSNHFIYDEAVHAGYLIFGNKVKNFSYQVGLRTEYSEVSGLLEETNESFNKSYLNFFPSVHLGRDIGKGHKLQISYSRRIQRPSFWNLNPFMSHADPFNIWAGNPNLNPELTHSIELSDIWYGKFSSASGTIYYRHTDSLITRIRTIDEDGIATTLPRNLNTADAVGVEFTLGTPIAKWWRINGSANFYYQITDGRNLDSSYTAEFFSYSARMMSFFTLWKGGQVQVMTNYRGPEVSPQGKRLAMVFFDVGLKQDVLKSKGTLTLRFTDPLNTQRFRFVTEVANYTIESWFKRHSRGVVLNFTYKLNNFKQRERQGGEQYQMEEIGF